MNVAEWITQNFSVQGIKGSEYRIQCPSCNKDKLYFNVQKRVGFCQYAGCRFHTEPVFIRTLREFSVNTLSWPTNDDQEGIGTFGPGDPKAARTEPLPMPDQTQPLVEMVGGEIRSSFPIASLEVSKRGVNLEDQFRFDIHVGRGRIWIPIFANGELVQYLGRSVWWIPNTQKQKYMYADGPKVGNYLFNYGEIRSEPYITLVENTFNAIWLREAINATSIFGSNLTNEQVSLIVKSKAQAVLVLFDEDAIVKAAQAVTKLGEAGIPAKIVDITRQPDDHTFQILSYSPMKNALAFSGLTGTKSTPCFLSHRTYTPALSFHLNTLVASPPSSFSSSKKRFEGRS